MKLVKHPNVVHLFEVGFMVKKHLFMLYIYLFIFIFELFTLFGSFIL